MKSKKSVFFILISFTLIIFLSGCLKQKIQQIQLKEPELTTTYHYHRQQPLSREHAIANSLDNDILNLNNEIINKYKQRAHQYATRIARRIYIKPDNPRYRKHLKEILSFLISNFGPPLYKNEITIEIVNTASGDSKMLWTKNKIRVIKIQHADFYNKKPYHLAHELFHALYQTDRFIKIFPEFIAESMAMYAEYLYRCGDKLNNQQILNKINKQISLYNTNFSINYDLPFNKYPQNQIDLIYEWAAKFMLIQNQPKTNILLIRNMLMLAYDLPINRKLKFREVKKIFNLK